MPTRLPEAEVTPHVLAWARTSIGFAPTEVARRMRVGREFIENWEKGVERPSIAQAERLAALYRRPLAAFYLPRPPAEPEPPMDFRTLPGQRGRALSLKTRLAFRQAQRLQRIAGELARDLKMQAKPELPRIRLTGDPEAEAQRVRNDLGVTIDAQKGWRDKRAALNNWRSALEGLGILSFQLDFPAEEARGFSLPSSQHPAIVLSSHDGLGARSFSLFHELAHLSAGDSVVCDMAWRSRATSPLARVERFCNQFAAAFLVPKDALMSEDSIANVTTARDGDWPEEVVGQLATDFKVSREVLLLRLVSLGLASQAFYEEMRDRWRAEATARPKPKGFAASPARKSLSERGRSFVGMLRDAYSQGSVSYSDLSDLLGVKGKHIGKVFDLAAGIA